MCVFVSGLLQHVRQLQASSRMNTMTLEQLLNEAQVIMIDEERCRESVAASTDQTHSDSRALPVDSCSKAFICYTCSGPNHMVKDCMQGCQRGQMVECGSFTMKYDALDAMNLGTCHQGNAEEDETSAPVFSLSK